MEVLIYNIVDNNIYLFIIQKFIHLRPEECFTELDIKCELFKIRKHTSLSKTIYR